MKRLIFTAIIIASIPSHSLAMNYHRVNFINNLPNETVRIYDLNDGPCGMGSKEPPCPIMPRQTKSITFLGNIVVFNTKTMGGTPYPLQMKKVPQNITFTYSKKENYIDIFCDNKLLTTFENKGWYSSKK